jgi:hypothetical protein
MPSVKLRNGGDAGAQRLLVDIDWFVGEVHGHTKQDAGYDYTSQRGYPPLDRQPRSSRGL